MKGIILSHFLIGQDMNQGLRCALSVIPNYAIQFLLLFITLWP